MANNERKTLVILIVIGVLLFFISKSSVQFFGVIQPVESIIDNSNSSFSTFGLWQPSTTIPGYYGSNYIFIINGSGASKAKWNLINIDRGRYEIYAMWTVFPNRATNAPYTINYVNGTETIRVNQQINGGVWNLLGTYNLESSDYIELNDDANGYVIADAIKMVQIESCSIVADINCDSVVDRAELGNFITKWVGGQATRTDLGNAIMAWIG